MLNYLKNLDQLSSDCLKNKIILITGATSGIGKELAITCSKFGATVIALGKNRKKLEKLYDEITHLNYSEPALVPFNLAGANPSEYQDLIQTIASQYNKLDGLVHNAAIQGDKTEIIHYDILKWFETLQVNLNAPFLLTKLAMPLLKLSKQSSIIFTTADQNSTKNAYQGAYGVSKAALTNLMHTIAEETENYTNIRVNAITPNKVYSRMYTQNYPGTNPDTMLHPKDIMHYYIYLLSDFSDQIHGQCINISTEIIN